MTLPISALWDETLTFIRREWHLLLPLCLATIAVGSAGANLAIDALDTESGWALIGLFASAILSLIGQLAVIVLLQTPGQSVGEALHAAAATLPKLVAVSVALVFFMLLLLIPLSVWLSANGYDAGSLAQELPPVAKFYLAAVAGFGLFLSARLITMNAAFVDQKGAIITTVKSVFESTRGHAGLLMGIIIAYLIVAALVSAVVSAIASAIFGSLGRLLDAPFAGEVLAALAGGIISAGLTLVSTVFVALLYRQLSSKAI